MTTTDALVDSQQPFPGTEGEPDLKRPWEQVALALFIAVPFVAVLAAVPLLWGWGLSWHDAVIAIVMYAITGHGITVGFHRHFTHRAFKAKRWLQVAMAIAGSMAIQGPVVRWVADHRRHHRFSDRDGDPHSPWRYGTSMRALTKGFCWSHLGWLFDVEQTSQEHYASDLLEDRAIAGVSRSFLWLVVASMAIPPIVGGLWGWSWKSALTAFFWGSLVRVSLLHHVTFSINSICHLTGRRPFKVRDRSGNVWWLSVLSMGESWHNLHHADPPSARHGVLRGQIDSSARIIWVLERMRLVHSVRWPDAQSIARRRLTASQPT